MLSDKDCFIASVPSIWFCVLTSMLMQMPPSALLGTACKLLQHGCCWLQAQAAEKCAGQLKLARAAAAEVKAAADAAGNAAAEARTAATEAETSPDLAACAAAQALATAAADKAAQSGAAHAVAEHVRII